MRRHYAQLARPVSAKNSAASLCGLLRSPKGAPNVIDASIAYELQALAAQKAALEDELESARPPCCPRKFVQTNFSTQRFPE
jgi:hypothetical protein